jgi:hypothetical protein
VNDKKMPHFNLIPKNCHRHILHFQNIIFVMKQSGVRTRIRRTYRQKITTKHKERKTVDTLFGKLKQFSFLHTGLKTLRN